MKGASPLKAQEKRLPGFFVLLQQKKHTANCLHISQYALPSSDRRSTAFRIKAAGSSIQSISTRIFSFARVATDFITVRIAFCNPALLADYAAHILLRNMKVVNSRAFLIRRIHID